MELIDSILNSITMYRLVLYYLILLVVVGVILAFFGVLPFSPYSLIFSALFLLVVGLITNKVFAKVFEVPTNVESVYISVLILALIIPPIKSLHDFGFLFWAAVLTMASKFIVAIKKKHIFNPVALAVSLTAIAGIGSATWWVGSLPMLPFVALGLFVVLKVRRYDMVFYFFLIYIISLVGFDLLRGANPVISLEKAVSDSPFVFFAVIMLTEPLTTPPTNRLQIVYGGLVGLLFSPQFHIASLYLTPELALLAGNLFSWAVSPKFKSVLTLKEKIKLSDVLYDFVFTPESNFSFTPGQYMEWTLSHPATDDRGNRRYFTLANSPTEADIRLGVKFAEKGSSYKQTMLNMKPGEKITAGNLMGDFTLPKDSSKKLVFIAGGIGITPFRSIIKYLIDKGEPRDIILLYTGREVGELTYFDVFTEAAKRLGIKTYYTLTGTVPTNWRGLTGKLSAEVIKKLVPDYADRTFYVSGSNTMVKGFEGTLGSIGLSGSQIVTDFFPGLS